MNIIHEINILFSNVVATEDINLFRSFIKIIKYQQDMLFCEENRIINQLKVCNVKNNINKKCLIHQIRNFPVYQKLKYYLFDRLFTKK